MCTDSIALTIGLIKKFLYSAYLGPQVWNIHSYQQLCQIFLRHSPNYSLQLQTKTDVCLTAATPVWAHSYRYIPGATPGQCVTTKQWDFSLFLCKRPKNSELILYAHNTKEHTKVLLTYKLTEKAQSSRIVIGFCISLAMHLATYFERWRAQSLQLTHLQAIKG